LRARDGSINPAPSFCFWGLQPEERIQVGTLTESMARLRDEIVTLRQKRSLGQAELARIAAERRAGVGAMRVAFSRDRAIAHRAWFGPTVLERRAELQKERRLAEEAKVHAQAEQKRRLAEEAKVQAQAEQKRKLAEEAKAVAQAEQDRKLAEEAAQEAAQEARVRMEAEAKAALAEEAAAAHAVPKATQKHKSSERHSASRQHKVSQDKPSQDKASKRHSSK
jgi:multidrug efflux pump subunit AcrA (membrane-fusion protein)